MKRVSELIIKLLRQAGSKASSDVPHLIDNIARGLNWKIDHLDIASPQSSKMIDHYARGQPPEKVYEEVLSILPATDTLTKETLRFKKNMMAILLRSISKIEHDLKEKEKRIESRLRKKFDKEIETEKVRNERSLRDINTQERSTRLAKAGDPDAFPLIEKKYKDALTKAKEIHEKRLKDLIADHRLALDSELNAARSTAKIKSDDAKKSYEKAVEGFFEEANRICNKYNKKSALTTFELYHCLSNLLSISTQPSVISKFKAADKKNFLQLTKLLFIVLMNRREWRQPTTTQKSTWLDPSADIFKNPNDTFDDNFKNDIAVPLHEIFKRFKGESADAKVYIDEEYGECTLSELFEIYFADSLEHANYDRETHWNQLIDRVYTYFKNQKAPTPVAEDGRSSSPSSDSESQGSNEDSDASIDAALASAGVSIGRAGPTQMFSQETEQHTEKITEKLLTNITQAFESVADKITEKLQTSTEAFEFNTQKMKEELTLINSTFEKEETQQISEKLQTNMEVFEKGTQKITENLRLTTDNFEQETQKISEKLHSSNIEAFEKDTKKITENLRLTTDSFEQETQKISEKLHSSNIEAFEEDTQKITENLKFTSRFFEAETQKINETINLSSKYEEMVTTPGTKEEVLASAIPEERITPTPKSDRIVEPPPKPIERDEPFIPITEIDDTVKLKENLTVTEETQKSAKAPKEFFKPTDNWYQVYKSTYHITDKEITANVVQNNGHLSAIETSQATLKKKTKMTYEVTHVEIKGTFDEANDTSEIKCTMPEGTRDIHPDVDALIASQVKILFSALNNNDLWDKLNEDPDDPNDAFVLGLFLGNNNASETNFEEIANCITDRLRRLRNIPQNHAKRNQLADTISLRLQNLISKNRLQFEIENPEGRTKYQLSDNVIHFLHAKLEPLSPIPTIQIQGPK